MENSTPLSTTLGSEKSTCGSVVEVGAKNSRAELFIKHCKGSWATCWLQGRFCDLPVSGPGV